MIGCGVFAASYTLFTSLVPLGRWANDPAVPPFAAIACAMLAMVVMAAHFARTTRAHNARMLAALDNMSQGLCMFDKNEKLVVCNRRYIDMYKLTPEVANAHVRRWLDEVANARVHATTKAVPATRLAEEQAVMLPAPALKAQPALPVRVALPIESLQHPLAVYDELLGVAA